MPGVGFVHASQCPVSPDRVDRLRCATLPGSPYVPNVVPEPLRSYVSEPGLDLVEDKPRAFDAEEREALMCELLFAARDVAGRNVHDGVAGPRLECRECWECRQVEHQGKIAHTANCSTGRVFAIVDKLTKLTRKEVPADQEPVRAGEGIRLRGLNDRLCPKCGKRGGEWLKEELGRVAEKTGYLAVYAHLGKAVCDEEKQ